MLANAPTKNQWRLSKRLDLKQGAGHLLLKSRGHRVSGVALDPPAEGLFERANISDDLENDFPMPG